jgi:adenylosuccinate synthase
MPLTIIVGGQYGSEGKGKVTAHLAIRDNVDIVVRCGGPNSGHTVDTEGRRYELRSLPAGFVNPGSRLLLAAGSLVDPAILLAEMKLAGVDERRVGVDYNAGIVVPSDAEDERHFALHDRLGSTLSGTGMAVAKRALRRPDFSLARDVPELSGLVTDVSAEVNRVLDEGGSVLVEGTQGFGLSVYHSPHYPFATSRDTTAGGFLGEIGVSPRLVTEIVMAIRTYPIRVGGNSGPLLGEITWEEVRRRSGYPAPVSELTTTTKRLRRVAAFDVNLVRRAVSVNRPTQLALHGTDYLSYGNRGVRQYQELERSSRSYIDWLEETIGVRISLIGTGPTNGEIVDRVG